MTDSSQGNAEEVLPSVARLWLWERGWVWRKGPAFEVFVSRFFRFLFLLFSLASLLDAMRAMNEATKDTVGDGGVADLLMPLGNRNLRSKDRHAPFHT